MTKVSRRATFAATLALAMGAFTACGSEDPDTTAAPAEGESTESTESTDSTDLPVVQFGATTNPSSIGTVAAVIEQENLDEACGIQLEFTQFSPDAADIALLSGQTNVGYFGYNSWAGSPDKLDRLRMIAPLQAEHGTLYVPEGSSAQTLEDLKGKKIALLPPVSGQYQDFRLLVAKMGMSLEEDFSPVTGPPPAIEAFLRRGEVDAAILFEPNATNLERSGGFRPIFSLNEQWESLTGNPLYMLGVSANADWLEDGHDAEAACAVEAVRGATRMLAEDPSVYEGLSDILGAEDAAHLEALTENLGSIYTPETAEEAEEAIKAQLDEAAELGVIPSAPDTVFTPVEG